MGSISVFIAFYLRIILIKSYEFFAVTSWSVKLNQRARLDLSQYCERGSDPKLEKCPDIGDGSGRAGLQRWGG